MQISWAIYGERNGGHALLGQSGNTTLAERITQFTDRPGDPPFGLEWGPVFSGFLVGEHYVFLKTSPDAKAGRAGMVRSYAAFIPTANLHFIENLEAIFMQLPSDLEERPRNLEFLSANDELLLKPRKGPIPPGLHCLARELCSAEPSLPLIWSKAEAYLPTVDALWSRLPPPLRMKFAFSFQFAPEHKIPATPILVATLPQLAARWPVNQIIYTDQSPHTPLNTAQKWLVGVSEGWDFTRALEDFGIRVTEFKDLSLLSSFADLTSRIEELTFIETRKAIRILEKFARPSEVPNARRKHLFKKLCALIPGIRPSELITLRNLDNESLNDLIPDLKASMTAWIDVVKCKPDRALCLLEVFEIAITTPDSWWAHPFIEWMRSHTTSSQLVDWSVFSDVVFSSQKLCAFAATIVPIQQEVETQIIKGLSNQWDAPRKATLLEFARQRDWMRLHATCILQTEPTLKVIPMHVKDITDNTSGLDLCLQKLGLPSLLAACNDTESDVFDRYVGRQLLSHFSELPDNWFTQIERWPILLCKSLEFCQSPLNPEMRHMLVAGLSYGRADDSALQSLVLQCCAIDIAVLLLIETPLSLLNSLTPTHRSQTIIALNEYVCASIKELIPVDMSAGFCSDVLDIPALHSLLGGVPFHKMTSVTINALQSLKQVKDSDLSRILVNLFTRTQFYPISHEEAISIGLLFETTSFPKSAEIVRETVERFDRKDAAPILDKIRATYVMPTPYKYKGNVKPARLPKVIIATALPLERDEVLRFLSSPRYDTETYADIALWPTENSLFEVFVITTGAGNLDTQKAMLRILNRIKPKLAFFVGVSGGIKDSNIGDVIYGTKVYYVEGGKEIATETLSRPDAEHTSEPLVQLAHRVAKSAWLPESFLSESEPPKATPAVIASSEKVLASTALEAVHYQRLKHSFNDTQVVDMEAYGFLTALRHNGVVLRMIIRGVSDQLEGKTDSDAKGNQPLAARNAAAFLFALLKSSSELLKPKRKRLFGLF